MNYRYGKIFVWTQFILLTVLFLSPLLPHKFLTIASGNMFFWRAAGLAFGVVSAIIGLSAFFSLGRHFTPLPEPKQTAQLVDTGIYKYIRHPMYSSVMFVSIGYALFWMNWATMLFALVILILFTLKTRYEESVLRAEWREYSDYCARSKRFLPWVF